MTLIPDHFTTVEPTDERPLPEESALVQPVPAVDREYVRQRMHAKPRMRLAKWSQAITWIYVTLEITLGFRVFLKFIGANPLNPFTQFIYHLTKPFVAPFMGLTVTPDVSGAAVLEISSLIGMISYGVMYWLVIRLIWILFNPAEPADSIRYDPDL
jgi:YggT family protein